MTSVQEPNGDSSESDGSIAPAISADYPRRLKYIAAALKACKLTHIGKGFRLEKIIDLYNHFYGKDNIGEIPVTDEAEILALVLDHVKLNPDDIKKHAPDLAAYYEMFLKSGMEFDTSDLYEFLKPEIKQHLKRYGLVK